MVHLVKLMQVFCIASIATVFHPENREEWISVKTVDRDSLLLSFIFCQRFRSDLGALLVSVHLTSSSSVKYG